MYEMTMRDHGMIVKGTCSVKDFTVLGELAKNHGFDSIDVGVAQSVGATFVFTNRSGSQKLREEIDAKNKDLSAEESWLRGYDTGISSLAIFEVMTGKPDGQNAKRPGNHPHDPDDFGRCFRLLERFRDWRDRIGEMSAISPQWGTLARHWPELEELYRKESSNMKAPRLYARMRELLDRQRGES
jgi:hypothetical protein